MSEVVKDLGKVTAYAYAKAAGYTGSEEDFQEIFDEFTEDAPGLLDRLDAAVDAAEAAQAAAEAAEASVDSTISTAVEEAVAAAEAVADAAVSAAEAAAEDAADAKEAAQIAAETFTTDKTLAVSDKAADAKVTGDEITGLKTAIDIADGEVFYPTLRDATSTASGWRLNESNGLCSSDSNYKLVKYTVTAGDIVKVVSDDRFQFQTVACVPSSGTSNRVGVT